MEGQRKTISAVTICGTVLFWAIFGLGLFTAGDAVWQTGFRAGAAYPIPGEWVEVDK